MSDLYSSLPLKSYTVTKFIEAAKELEQSRSPEFVRFLLTGEHVEQGHQAVVDPTRNELPIEHPIFATCNYDSMIGITDTLVVKAPVSVYVVPNPAEALKTSIHIKYFVSNENISGVYQPVHRIPNFEFGYWGTRHMIHVFFPGLAHGDRIGSPLSQEERVVFYEKGLRPAVETVLSNEASGWPSTYGSEMFRARKRSGHMAYQTKNLSDWVLGDLVDSIREHLEENEVEWAAGFFFMHSIRGTKSSTSHTKNADAAGRALDEFLMDAQLPLEAMEQGHWWVDVGLECISGLGECLQWATAAHHRVVENVLRIPEDAARRITKMGSSKYERDHVSHLMGVSGCRIEPGLQAEGEYGAVYFQMYTTDKAITYNPEGRYHGKAITVEEAMGVNQPPPFLEGLLDLYTNALAVNSSNARVEVRVPFARADTVLLDVRSSVFRRSLLSFKKSTWWNLRAYRAMAISQVLSQQAAGSPALRIKPEALLLTAACVWLINSLHSRPDTGSSARSLSRSVLPLTDAEDPDETTLLFTSRERQDEEDFEDDEEPELPYNPFGLIFLRRIVTLDVPRMRIGGALLSSSAFKYWFRASEAEIRHKYYSIGLVPRDAVARRRIVTNKTARTPVFIPSSDHDVTFDLASRGLALPPPPVDDGSDIEEHSDDENESGAQNSNHNIDCKVSNMWRQFLVDLVIKSPTPRGAASASYLTLTKPERLRVTEELYMNTKLSDMWNAIRYKVSGTHDWKLAFSHLFPEPQHETANSVQNYTQCAYYITWKEICATADRGTAEAIRKEVLKKFLRLKWVPQAAQDKIWQTAQPKGASARAFQRLPPGSTGPAPRILVRRTPEWESVVESE